jgi:hypothetical protein
MMQGIVNQYCEATLSIARDSFGEAGSNQFGEAD